MKNNFPKSCSECDKASTCNNPGPYGSYRCVYRAHIEEAILRATLSSYQKKEVNNNGNR
jgi:hypothetical protein